MLFLASSFGRSIAHPKLGTVFGIMMQVRSHMQITGHITNLTQRLQNTFTQTLYVLFPMPNTRSQMLAETIKRAHQQPFRAVIFLRSEHKITAFLETVLHNHAVANGTQSLHVILHWQLQQVTQLCKCLKCLHFLEDLELILPHLSPPHWVHLLHDLRFPRLDLLQTNAPHSIVATFLKLHNDLVYLSIKACGRTKRPCPLGQMQLSNLRDTSGPLGCIVTLTQHSPVSRVSAQLSFVMDHDPVVTSTLTLTLLMVADNITVLELEFDPTDVNVLECIASNTPALRSLKLVEIKSTMMSRISHRRAWKSAEEWGKTLRRLTFLQNFALCTSIAVTPIPGDINREYRLVSQWGGCKTPHPTLRHVILWYLYGTLQDHMTYWNWRWSDREHCWSRWEQTNRFDSPNSSLFV
ncbi:hypothetical protein BKA82DRAFT_1000403 [Pisolithus tinctorius]|nr:hypothetical protein BKA82DRAFT_1000403 [Pisolithus tinctorius]